MIIEPGPVGNAQLQIVRVERTVGAKNSHHGSCGDLERDDELAREVLVVSALVGTPSYSQTARQFKDGYITKSGTFQKYFQQHELADLVHKNTGVEPIALGRGTILAFKSDEQEQSFLAQRLSRRKQARLRVRITDLNQLSEDARSHGPVLETMY